MKFGFNLKNKAPNALAKAGAKPVQKKKKPLLDDDEDDDIKGKAKAANGAQEIAEFNFDDTLTSAPEPSKPSSSKPKKGQPIAPPSHKPKPKHDDPTLSEHSASAREAEQRAQEALAADATIYDYDAAYEAQQASLALKKAAEQADPSGPKTKYMDSLFAAAELRKADQQRARDKQLQRERENEGDEFADKEKFVTSAYVSAQEESLRAEAEEKARVAAEEENRRKYGMQGFHKQMLAEREKRHQEAVEAAAQVAKQGIKLPSGAEEKRKDEQELIAELKRQGKDIHLNEAGEIADKTQLLKAGLNVVAKPKPTSTSTPSSTIPARAAVPMHAKGGRHAQRERQTQMVAQQIEAAAKRKADEDAQEEAKLLHASKSQKTQTDILGAKERYLQRKREAAAAKEKEKGGK
jgi:coiled-coil domain-containing protein 55